MIISLSSSLKTSVVLTLLLGFYTLGHSQAQNRPNVILILADDLGYGDLSCYNSASKIQTPHLDHMATMQQQPLGNGILVLIGKQSMDLSQRLVLIGSAM